MSALAARAELVKVCQVLDVDDAELEFLSVMPETQLRRLRDALGERLFDQDRRAVRRLARLVGKFPVLAPWLARRAGPLLSARIVGELPARRGAAIAMRMEVEEVARICLHLDPRRARDLIVRIPDERIVAIALAMVAHKDYTTMGRFVDFLSDAALSAVIASISDEAELLRIAFFMDSHTRLDHVVRLLPVERRRRVVLLALDREHDLLDEILCVVANVNYALKGELGNLAAEQDEGVLVRIIERTQQRGLWADLLPVVACVSPDNQHKVSNLPVLRERPDILASLLRAADEAGLWRITLPLVEKLDETTREAFAAAAASLPREAIARAAQSVLLGELWEPMFDLVRRMPTATQETFAAVLADLTGVDPELDARVIAGARAHGLEAALESAGLDG